MFYHLVFDGVADGPLGVALDVVASAAQLVRSGAGAHAGAPTYLDQKVVSVGGAPVRSRTGRPVAVDGDFETIEVHPHDVVVIAGLGATTDGLVTRLLSEPAVRLGAARLALAAAAGARLAASCSATFVLASAGVLDGGEATTTWWLSGAFACRFPKVTLRSDKMVIRSRGHVAAGAALAHADLMLAVLADVAGPTLARLVGRYLVLAERVSQSRYLVLEHLRSADPAILALEAFVLGNLDRQLALTELARAAGTSPRTLARRVAEALGTTPQGFVKRLRLARAQQLLQTTREPIDAIAEQVGYSDAAAFRRLYRRELGEAPGARRRSSMDSERSEGGVRAIAASARCVGGPSVWCESARD